MNRYISRRLWLLAALGAFLAAEPLALRAQSGPFVWVVPALTRVARDEAPGRAREIALWAGRGEYESFQVVVRAPAGGLKNVSVAISDLAGGRGQIGRASC